MHALSYIPEELCRGTYRASANFEISVRFDMLTMGAVELLVKDFYM